MPLHEDLIAAADALHSAQRILKAGSDPMTLADFVALVKQLAEPRIGNKQLKIKGHVDSGQVFINFINLPVGAGGAGGGAEAENNRTMLLVEGFGDPRKTAWGQNKDDTPAAKVKVKTSVSLFRGQGQDSLTLRAKTANPGAIAKYIADHLAKCAEVESSWTHTKPEER